MPPEMEFRMIQIRMSLKAHSFLPVLTFDVLVAGSMILDVLVAFLKNNSHNDGFVKNLRDTSTNNGLF